MAKDLIGNLPLSPFWKKRNRRAGVHQFLLDRAVAKQQVVRTILRSGEQFGRQTRLQREKINVEFVQPTRRPAARRYTARQRRWATQFQRYCDARSRGIPGVLLQRRGQPNRQLGISVQVRIKQQRGRKY